MATLLTIILVLIGLYILLPIVGGLLAVLAPMLSGGLIIVLALIFLGVVIGRVTRKK